MMLLSLWSYLKRAIVWISKNLWKFLVAFFGGLSVILGISYLIQKRKAATYKSDAKFLALKARVEGLNNVRILVEEENEKDEKEIVRIEEEKDKLRAEVEEMRKVHDMTDEEILVEFKKLYP